jgi:hypothetical protein
MMLWFDTTGELLGGHPPPPKEKDNGGEQFKHRPARQSGELSFDTEACIAIHQWSKVEWRP